jgi:hypothetical protein
MSVYKEGFYALQMIENQSTQVFTDSCDFGAPTKKGDQIWNAAKQLVDWYGDKATRRVEKYGTGITVTTRVTLLDEWTTGQEYVYDVSYITLRNHKKMDGYIYLQKIN